MRLSRLELHGFKSFPDRTTFHFGPGVSCVVGPNGSGKSNVVDALKWCIGEQSAKSLRGSEMTDVIFAGSADRKPVGYAEVILTLITDEQRPFPGEYCALGEVQVGRRLHRSGASEYSINQTRVRRRDVIELLLDSGIGNDLYSFIQQGQVDKMISASPEERRSLIDEAAGISRYKARRDEARERLEATAAQLDRAADVVDEMARHLRSLEGQVLKAAEFRRHGALVRLGELRLALAKHLALTEDRRSLRMEIDAMRLDETQRRSIIEAREQDLLHRREEIGVVDAGIATLRDRVAELDGTIRESNASAQLHERRERELRSEAARALREAEIAEARGKAAVEEAESIDAEIEEIEDALAEAEHAMAGAEAEVAEADRALAAVRTERGAAEEEVQRAMAARMAAENVVSAAERARGERELKIASLEADRAEQRADRTRSMHARQAAEHKRTEASVRLEAVLAAVAAADDALAEARGAEIAAQQAFTAAEDAREAALAEQRARERERTEAIERGRRWVAAAERLASERIRATEAERSRRITEREARGRAEVVEARRQAEARAAAEGTALEREGALRRVELDAAVNAAAAALGQAKAAHDAAEREHVRLSRSRAAVEAELDEVRRQLKATSGASAALRKAVPDLRTVAELAPDDRRGEWVERLGDRAAWPVARTVDALLTLAAARPEAASLNVLLWPEGEPCPADSVRIAEDLRDGASGAWPVVGPAFRIDVGGFVTMGPPGALQRAVAAEQSLGERVRQLAEELEVASGARAVATAALEAAEQTHRTAVSTRDVEVRVHLAELEAARSARAEAVAAAEGTAREAAASALEAETRARDTALSALREQTSEEIASLRATLDAFQSSARDAGPSPASSADLASLRTAVREAGARTEAARTARERTIETRLAAERARDEATAAVTAVDGDIRRSDARIEDCSQQIAALAAQRTGGDDAALEDSRRIAAEAAQLEAAAREALGARRAAVEAAEKRERSARAEVGQLAVERASSAERASGARERRTSAEARAEEAAEGATRARKHASGLAAQADEAAAARTAALEQVASARTERGESWERLQEERERVSRLGEARDTVETELREARETVEEIARRIEQMTAQHGSVASELEVLRGRIDDRYQVSLQAMLERLRVDQRLVLEVDPEVVAGVSIGGDTVEGVAPVVLTLADLRDEKRVRAAVTDLDAHRQALSRLGEVNLAAPAEYRALLVRHDELAAQRTDLEQSVDGIRTAIAKLNRMCRERFRETFDRVNDYFREVYPRLVGGGSARLSLTDEEDLLETGVEIFVQPPGKRLQNLQLLSGGEKAMTAIALLIALFRVKPSPFCVLDEVDAPLDEANGARFNEMLKEMSGRSQFLVITHNRKTMECADTLYGITMARPGVSRLVSVDLDAW